MPKNTHLLSSGVIVFIAGTLYGGNPRWFMDYFFGVSEISMDVVHILRAVMGIYFGIAIFWLLGTWKEAYWKAATLSNVLFMGGISLGRIIALFIDGFSLEFGIALVLELLYCIWGIFNLKKYEV